MRISSFLIAMMFAFLATSGVSSAQIVLGQVDDFSNAADGAAGWREGNASPNPPVFNAGPGLDGLAGHLQNISSGAGAGGRWQMFNDDLRWTGDYLAAGVSEVLFDFNNVSGNGVDANVRIGFNGTGGWFVSDAINIADGSDWQTVGFDLFGLTHIAASGGTGILNDTLSSVSRFEILSSVSTPDFAAGGNLLRGDQIQADFRVDNISAVPEPASALLLVGGLCAVALRRRR